MESIYLATVKLLLIKTQVTVIENSFNNYPSLFKRGRYNYLTCSTKPLIIKCRLQTCSEKTAKSYGKQPAMLLVTSPNWITAVI